MDWRWLAWQVYDGAFWRQVVADYDWLQQSQWWSAAQLRSYQQERLAELLQHAADYVPYYRQLGLAPALSAFPVLSRKLISHDLSPFLSTAPPAGREYRWTSSGSSGEPVAFLVSERSQALRRAALLRGDTWGTTLPPTTSMFTLTGNPRDHHSRTALKSRLYDWVHNRRVGNCFEMNTERARELHAAFHKYRPQILTGYVSALRGYIHFAEQLGLKPPRIAKVMPGSETCTAKDRALIEGHFQTLVLERYAANEVGPLAHQCEQGNWHVHCENLLLEVLQPDGSISSSGAGSLLVTSLSNLRLPTIRYEIGDRVDITDAPCACGRGLPTLRALQGRLAEQLTRLDGTQIGASAIGFYLDQTPHAHYRFIQDAPDHIQLLLQFKDAPTAALMDYARERCAVIFGPGMRIDVEAVDHIPPLPNGKNPGVLNLVARRASEQAGT